MSLVESIISLTILAVVALGVLKVLIFTQQVGQQGLLDKIVYMSAQSYAEQIKALEYNVLKSIAKEGNGAKIPVKHFFAMHKEIPLNSDGTIPELSLSEKLSDDLILNEWNAKDFIVDLDSGSGSDVQNLLVRFRPTIVDLEDTSITAKDRRKYLRITIDYEYTPPAGSASRKKQTGALNFFVTDENFAPSEFI